MVQGEKPSPLDEAQEFAVASSYQVRDELAGLIERDLLGSVGRGARGAAAAFGGDGADGELPELLTMQNAGRMWASPRRDRAAEAPDVHRRRRRRPDEARFFHQDCPRRRNKPLAVAARFVLACVNGHLDFPSGSSCTTAVPARR